MKDYLWRVFVSVVAVGRIVSALVSGDRVNLERTTYSENFEQHKSKLTALSHEGFKDAIRNHFTDVLSGLLFSSGKFWFCNFSKNLVSLIQKQTC